MVENALDERYRYDLFGGREPIFIGGRSEFYDLLPEEEQEIQDQVCWEQLLTFLKIGFKKRSSGVLVRLCTFHGERTPSLFFRPSGFFNCYGCGEHGSMAEFVGWYHFANKPHNNSDVINYLTHLPPLECSLQPRLPGF